MLPLDVEHLEVAKARAGRLAQASAVRLPDIPNGMRGIESPKGGSVPTFGQSGNGEPGRCKAQERRQGLRFEAARFVANGAPSNPPANQIPHAHLRAISVGFDTDCLSLR